ncbi:MAG: hypothetical protein E6040_02915 [Lachnospiraceae bacterium]|nr:hypothetical protein [Lachnospiraceae bacterium]
MDNKVKIDLARIIGLFSASIYVLSRIIWNLMFTLGDSIFITRKIYLNVSLVILSFIMIWGLIKVNSKNKFLLALPKLVIIILSMVDMVGIITNDSLHSYMPDSVIELFLSSNLIMNFIVNCIVFIILCILISNKNKDLIKFLGFLFIVITIRQIITFFDSFNRFINVSDLDLRYFSGYISQIAYFIYEICTFILLWRLSVCGSSAYIQQMTRNDNISDNIIRDNSDIEVQTNSAYQNLEADNVDNPQDKPSIGLNILAFCMPIIGLILYFAWKNTYPKKANSIGKIALIGAIFWTITYILLNIFSASIVYWLIMSS